MLKEKNRAVTLLKHSIVSEIVTTDAVELTNLVFQTNIKISKTIFIFIIFHAKDQTSYGRSYILMEKRTPILLQAKHKASACFYQITSSQPTSLPSPKTLSEIIFEIKIRSITLTYINLEVEVTNSF